MVVFRKVLAAQLTCRTHGDNSVFMDSYVALLLTRSGLGTAQSWTWIQQCNPKQRSTSQ